MELGEDHRACRRYTRTRDHSVQNQMASMQEWLLQVLFLLVVNLVLYCCKTSRVVVARGLGVEAILIVSRTSERNFGWEK